MSAETRAALSKLADSVGAIQAQIDAGNVVTRKDFVQNIDKVNGSLDEVSKEIANRLAKMDNGVHALPRLKRSRTSTLRVLMAFSWRSIPATNGTGLMGRGLMQGSINPKETWKWKPHESGLRFLEIQLPTL